MTSSQPSRRPISTYRLQFHGDFRFADAQEIVPYLSDLGVTECYSSPLLKANPGSQHGYDICEHGQLNPELGSRADFDRFCDALQEHRLGHILDIVPNHMACDPRSNPWWRDVLENGPSSPFSSFFDIDWNPVKDELKGKVLLPVLGDQYGRVLERGELQLRFADGALHLHYFDQEFPINPRRTPLVLGLHLDELQQQLGGEPGLREYLSILTALQNLPAYTERDAARIVERQREKEVARERLARLVDLTPPIRAHVEACVGLANGVPGDAASFDLLHGLLELQAYRLAYWRTAADEINYRRFFDINELVGLRMEEPAVFEAAHSLIRGLVGEGKVTGLRVDHPDGLFDPAAYFDRLQQMTREVGAPGGTVSPEAPSFYVVAEKILSSGESLSADWQVHGTTGYGFLNALSGLFVDGRQLRRLQRIYARFTGGLSAFGELAYQSKRTIMLTSMASELNVLAHDLNRLSERDRRSRDFTLNSCRKALREAAACFSAYRTYVSARGASAFDRATVEAALAEARRRNPLMEASIFDFLREILLPAPPGEDASEGDTASERLRFAMKMQQFTSPVQAKGVEDTAFYRYNVLISANDVGGHPDRPAVTPADFHEANQQRAARWPLEMITTATHDTKRGEDARARLNVLSEMPDAWRGAVSAWARINARNRTKSRDGWAPDRNDEYLFYQALLGAWPMASAASGADGETADQAVRLGAYMQKAIREAKVHTSWIDENRAYADALARFVEKTLTGRTAERFLASFLPFQRRVAALGMINSLSQLVLKLASPGVPDCYQGTELWDLSLVDPDNRRPVDFAHRRRLMETLRPLAERIGAGRASDEEVADLLTHWEDGRIKLFVLMCGLRFRRDHPALMAGGAYRPLEADGPAADRLVGFARVDDSGILLAIVPRLIVPLVTADRPLPLGDAWESTGIMLPEGLAGRRYTHVLTGETIEAGRPLAAAAVFRTSPVALLWAGAS